MKQRIWIAGLALVVVAVVSSGCATPKKPQPFTVEGLRNAEYFSLWPAMGRAKLANGFYREKFNPGSSTEIVIRMSDHVAMGDLDGDKVEDAAVILISTPGGSGTFYDLAAVVNAGGVPSHVDTEPLGDRVKIKSLTISSGTILLDLIVHGPKDPMCCPTVEVTRRYRLEGNKLARVK